MVALPEITPFTNAHVVLVTRNLPWKVRFTFSNNLNSSLLPFLRVTTFSMYCFVSTHQLISITKFWYSECVREQRVVWNITSRRFLVVFIVCNCNVGWEKSCTLSLGVVFLLNVAATVDVWFEFVTISDITRVFNVMCVARCVYNNNNNNVSSRGIYGER